MALSLQEEEISRGNTARHGRGNQHRGQGHNHGSSGQPGGQVQNPFLAHLLGATRDFERPRSMPSETSSLGMCAHILNTDAF